MKKITIKQLVQNADAMMDVAQLERVVVVQNGKPVAVILGLKYKDEEDYALEKDKAFWQMIRERRRERKMIPWEDVKKELGLDQPKPRTSRRVAKTTKG